MNPYHANMTICITATLAVLLAAPVAAQETDVYLVEAIGDIQECGQACVVCPFPFGATFCAASTLVDGIACASPEWSQCIGSGGTIIDLRVTYTTLFEGMPFVLTAHEFFAPEQGRPVQMIVYEDEIFADGFESGDTSAWSTADDE